MLLLLLLSIPCFAANRNIDADGFRTTDHLFTVSIPRSGAASTTFWRGDGTWNQVSLTAGVSGILPVANSTVANHAQGTCNTSTTLDWTGGRSFTMTLTNGATCAITFSGAVSGQTITIAIYQPTPTGSGAVSWATTTLWAGGTAPTITTGALKTDTCTITYNGTDYRGSCVQDMR